MPRYVTIDFFGKVGVGKTTIFNQFAGDRYLEQGGNLSYDFRTYYARCWVLPNRWTHSMVFLADPKFEMRWKDLRMKFLRKMFEPTNILMIVTDSTPEDVEAVKNSFAMYPKVKRSLIIFIIANMQDLPGRMDVPAIQAALGLKDVLGLSAIQPGVKEKVEPFIEAAVKRYFLMLSKLYSDMELVEDLKESGIESSGSGNSTQNKAELEQDVLKPAVKPSKATRPSKYSERLLKKK